MKNKQYDHLLKFVMVGDSAVGKSSLLLRFADNQFNQNYMITIGVDFRFKSLRIHDRIVKLQIWDTAGQQRFRTIVNTYYKNTQAVFLIFDLTNRQTFNDIKNYWLNQVQSYTQEGIYLVLIGNKADCQRNISNQEIQQFVNQKGLNYYETSAKTGANVQQAFLAIAQAIVSRASMKLKEKANFTKLTQTQSIESRQNCQC